MLAAWTADTPLPHDFLRALTRMLIDENAGTNAGRGGDGAVRCVFDHSDQGTEGDAGCSAGRGRIAAGAVAGVGEDADARDAIADYER